MECHYAVYHVFSVMLSVVMQCRYTECRYTECRYVEYRGAHRYAYLGLS
jgi:hypothetical protein